MILCKTTRVRTCSLLHSSLEAINANRREDGMTYPGYLLQPLLHEGSISKAYYSCYKAKGLTLNLTKGRRWNLSYMRLATGTELAR